MLSSVELTVTTVCFLLVTEILLTIWNTLSLILSLSYFRGSGITEYTRNRGMIQSWPKIRNIALDLIFHSGFLLISQNIAKTETRHSTESGHVNNH